MQGTGIWGGELALCGWERRPSILGLYLGGNRKPKMVQEQERNARLPHRRTDQEIQAQLGDQAQDMMELG